MSTTKVYSSILILSLLLGVNVLLFFGIFANSPMITEYDTEYHYIINRGYWKPWSGWSASDNSVPSHLTQLPFLERGVGIDSREQVVKVVYTKRVLTYLAQGFILNALALSLLVHLLIKKLKKDGRSTRQVGSFLIAVCIFQVILTPILYFLWLPRI